MATNTEYVVYNVTTDNVLTQPAPREMAARICNAFNDAYSEYARYAIRPVVDFDYDGLVEAAHQEDLSGWDDAWQPETDAEVSTNDFERQWAMSLHPWAWRGIAVWFVVFNVVGVVALWAR